MTIQDLVRAAQNVNEKYKKKKTTTIVNSLFFKAAIFEIRVLVKLMVFYDQFQQALHHCYHRH